MTIKSVRFMSREAAETFIPDDPTVAISLSSPDKDAALLHHDICAVLRLFFHDAVSQITDSTVLFDEKLARQIVDFIDLHHAKSDSYDLIVHCEAGISRSAAVAAYAASECQVPLSGYFALLNPVVLHHLTRCKSPQHEFDRLFE